MSDISAAAYEKVEVVEFANEAGSPSVSVVVPMFEHFRFIPQLLRNIGWQDLGSAGFEFVLVDDGSRNPSLEATARLAESEGVSGKAIRLPNNRGRATARNLGVLHANGEVIAFTDADCLPAPDWLKMGVRAFGDLAVGVAQGVTRPEPGQRQPLFNHFIEIQRFDGSYSTCNVFYRKQALLEVGGFDQSIVYWEDLDLGWRVRKAGWDAKFVREAVVFHQVIPLSAQQWLAWPRHFRYMPAKVRRHPEYRSHLFLGIWVDWFHAVFDLAVVSVPLAVIVSPALLALALPYLIAFPLRRGLRGRLPPLKAALHLAWDTISMGVLLWSSLRHRRLVL